MATSAKNLRYNDPEQVYVKKGYVITWSHIPSGNSVTFKGILTAFSDKFSSEWQEESVYGRSDPISNFKATKRQITIGWDMIAAHVDEARENLGKCSLLATFLYPTYKDGNGGSSTITAAPLLKLRFANLLQSVGGTKGGLVGYINGGFSIDPQLEDEFFDPSAGLLYPKHIKINCTFTVLHTHPLGWDTAGRIRTGKYPYGQSLPGVQANAKAISDRNAEIAMDAFAKGQENLDKYTKTALDNQRQAQEGAMLNAQRGFDASDKVNAAASEANLKDFSPIVAKRK
jgi:hypothetical protein